MASHRASIVPASCHLAELPCTYTCILVSINLIAYLVSERATEATEICSVSVGAGTLVFSFSQKKLNKIANRTA